MPARHHFAKTITHIGLAQRSGTLVADNTAREVGEDRGQGCLPWSLCHFSIGRSGRAKGPVPENRDLN